MLRKISYIIGFCFITVVVIAQQNGTPSQLRVLTDANDYLLATAASQTLPISQPTLFSNARLRTDADGKLLVVVSGGITPADAFYLLNQSNASLSNGQVVNIFPNSTDAIDIRRTTHDQTVNIYNSYTDGSNNSGLTISADTSDGLYKFGMFKNGTGTAIRILEFEGPSNLLLSLNQAIAQPGLLFVPSSSAAGFSTNLKILSTGGNGLLVFNRASDTATLKIAGEGNTAWVLDEASPSTAVIAFGVGEKANPDEGTFSDANTYFRINTTAGQVELPGKPLKLGVDVGSGTNYIEGFEQTPDPSAPASNGFRLFAKDNGGGKTQLCVIFNTGATQCFATQP